MVLQLLRQYGGYVHIHVSISNHKGFLEFALGCFALDGFETNGLNRFAFFEILTNVPTHIRSSQRGARPPSTRCLLGPQARRALLYSPRFSQLAKNHLGWSKHSFSRRGGPRKNAPWPSVKRRRHQPLPLFWGPRTY